MDATALVLLMACAYLALAAVDGLWIHLVRLGLHRHAASRFEHRLHTLRAALFPVILLLVVNLQAAGVCLWLGVAAVCADFACVAWDAAEETDSRAFLGGLPAFEAALHTILQALHATLVATALLLRPASSWAADQALGFPPGVPGLILGGLIAGSVAVFALHVLLDWSGRRIRR